MKSQENDTGARADLVGQAEALERIAGRLRLQARGSQDFARVPVVRDLVVRAVDWDHAEEQATAIVELEGVTVEATVVRWSLGAGVFRVRVEGVQYHQPTLAAA